MKHQFLTHEDFRPDKYDSYRYRLAVEGGLAICKVCGLAEGALTTDCPETSASNRSDDIYSGKIDYREDAWVEAKNPTNQMWDSGGVSQ